jgi:hypothetical protein
LTLVRARSDGEVERLALGPFFDRFETPGSKSGPAVLQRWRPMTDGPNSDLKQMDPKLADDNFDKEVSKRDLVEVMQVADFDHDGRATEFLIQVGTMPCGKHEMVLVGISQANPHLHAFSSVEEPGTPLVLGAWVWAALLKSDGPVDVVEWPCGDHGSDIESRVLVEAQHGLLHAKHHDRKCAAQEQASAPFNSTPPL